MNMVLVLQQRLLKFGNLLQERENFEFEGEGLVLQVVLLPFISFFSFHFFLAHLQPILALPSALPAIPNCWQH